MSTRRRSKQPAPSSFWHQRSVPQLKSVPCGRSQTSQETGMLREAQAMP